MALAEPSWALGLAVPFLATAALLSRSVGWLKRLNRHTRGVEMIRELRMMAVGILVISGIFSLLNSLLIRITPEWLLRYPQRRMDIWHQKTEQSPESAAGVSRGVG